MRLGGVENGIASYCGPHDADIVDLVDAHNVAIASSHSHRGSPPRREKNQVPAGLWPACASLHCPWSRTTAPLWRTDSRVHGGGPARFCSFTPRGSCGKSQGQFRWRCALGRADLRDKKLLKSCFRSELPVGGHLPMVFFGLTCSFGFTSRLYRSPWWPWQPVWPSKGSACPPPSSRLAHGFTWQDH